MIRQERSTALLRRFPIVPGAVAMLIACSGCGTSPETHYYTLSAAPQNAAPVAPVSAQGNFAIGAITLPRILDQPQIAQRVGPNQIDYAEYDRWAASLDDLVRHALTEDLSTELGMPVLPTANAPGGTPQQTVQLDIERFEADAGGSVSLNARWTVSGMDYPPSVSVSGHAEVTAPSQGSVPAAIAQTMSAAVGSLSSQIAQTVRATRTTLPPKPLASSGS